MFLWVYFTELINLTDVEGLQTVELMGYHQRKTLLDQLSDHIFAGFFVAGLVHFNHRCQGRVLSMREMNTPQQP